MHTVDPGMLTLGLFIWLGIFMGISGIINLILKKKRVNGAMIYLFFAMIILVISLISAMHSANPARVIGMLMGAYALPILVSLLLMIRFRRKYTSPTKEPSNQDT